MNAGTTRRATPPLAWAWLLTIATAALAGDDGAAPRRFAGKVSTLKIEAAELGADWTGPTGLVLDDVADPSSAPEEVRPIATELAKTLAPLGCRAAADFTYRKGSDPLDQATIRVLAFDDEAKARAWWDAKFRDGRARGEYRDLEGLGDEALEHGRTARRFVRVGDVVLTAGSLKPGGGHAKILDAYLARLEAASRGGTPR